MTCHDITLTLHYITIHSVQYSTVQYSTVQYSTVQYSILQYIAVHCSTLQYIAVHYSTLHYIQVYIYTYIGYNKPTPAKSGDGKLFSNYHHAFACYGSNDYFPQLGISRKDLSIIQWSSQINDHFGWLNVFDAQWNHIKSQFMTHYKNHFLASWMIKSTAKDVMKSTERTGCSAFECLITFHYHISPLIVCICIYIWLYMYRKGRCGGPIFTVFWKSHWKTSLVSISSNAHCFNMF